MLAGREVVSCFKRQFGDVGILVLAQGRSSAPSGATRCRITPNPPIVSLSRG
jgi:hypothetical protein